VSKPPLRENALKTGKLYPTYEGIVPEEIIESDIKQAKSK